MVDPYTKENPGNLANDPDRARETGHKGGQKISERYLSGAQEKSEC